MEQQHNQPELYGVLLTQFKDEDAVLGLAAQLRMAIMRHEGEDRINTIRSEIQDAAGRLVKDNLEERRIRIEETRALLDKEEATLEADNGKFNSLVEQRARQIFNQVINRGGPTTYPSAQ
jgi:hypothetical protein